MGIASGVSATVGRALGENDPFKAKYLVSNSQLQFILATIVMGIGGVINLILDYMFIFGMGPIPAMALKGAAYATVRSCASALLLIFSPTLGRIFTDNAEVVSHIKSLALANLLGGILSDKMLTKWLKANGSPLPGQNRLAVYRDDLLNLISRALRFRSDQ